MRNTRRKCAKRTPSPDVDQAALIEQLRKELSEEKIKNTVLESHCAELQAKFVKFKNEVRAMEHQMSVAAKEVDKKTEEADQYLFSKLTLQKRSTKLHAENMKLRNEVANLKQQLHEKEKSLEVVVNPTKKRAAEEDPESFCETIESTIVKPKFKRIKCSVQLAPLTTATAAESPFEFSNSAAKLVLPSPPYNQSPALLLALDKCDNLTDHDDDLMAAQIIFSFGNHSFVNDCVDMDDEYE
ncbi:hypothetical protein HDU97_009499 [Phlyctochytrium planicorne]|nr:hypothetical protein HDU97_009499 [Phlyctochytrium planicorne]